LILGGSYYVSGFGEMEQQIAAEMRRVDADMGGIVGRSATARSSVSGASGVPV
jgi:hypothetical protein